MSACGNGQIRGKQPSVMDASMGPQALHQRVSPFLLLVLLVAGYAAASAVDAAVRLFQSGHLAQCVNFSVAFCVPDFAHDAAFFQGATLARENQLRESVNLAPPVLVHVNPELQLPSAGTEGYTFYPFVAPKTMPDASEHRLVSAEPAGFLAADLAPERGAFGGRCLADLHGSMVSLPALSDSLNHKAAA